MQLDIFESRRARERGVTKARRGTDPEWRATYARSCYAFLASTAVGGTFTGEDLRMYATNRGLPKPPHHNVWGACANSVLREWFNMGMIVDAGFGQLKTVRSHARRTPLYRRTGWLQVELPDTPPDQQERRDA